MITTCIGKENNRIWHSLSMTLFSTKLFQYLKHESLNHNRTRLTFCLLTLNIIERPTSRNVEYVGFHYFPKISKRSISYITTKRHIFLSYHKLQKE